MIYLIYELTVLAVLISGHSKSVGNRLLESIVSFEVIDGILFLLVSFPSLSIPTFFTFPRMSAETDILRNWALSR